MSTGEAPLQETFERCREMDASLAERLAIMADAVRKWWPMGTEAVDRLVGRLRAERRRTGGAQAWRYDAAVPAA